MIKRVTASEVTEVVNAIAVNTIEEKVEVLVTADKVNTKIDEKISGELYLLQHATVRVLEHALMML